MLEFMKDYFSGNRFVLVSYYPDMHAEVYRAVEDHHVEPLYLNTVLNRLGSTSPLIIELKAQDDLPDRLRIENLLIFSAPESVDFSQAVEQLRARMFVRYNGGIKGLFHYYHPKVASYFFSRSATEDTDRWLGCFDSVTLYRQTYSEPDAWICIAGEQSCFEQQVWSLTPSQEEALNNQLDEQNNQNKEVADGC